MGNDLTQGNIAKTLLRFTGPFMLANLLQSLYGIVDMLIVGQFSDSYALAAVSLGSLIMATLNFVLIGLGTGATVLVGQLTGAKKHEEVKEAIATTFTIFPLIALGMTVIFLPLRSLILTLMNTPAEAFDYAEQYLRVCMYGVVFTGSFNAIAGAMRGIGNSKAPTVFITIACVVNIIGDIICVGVFGMGAYGAAVATVVAQGVSVAVGLVYIARSDFPFELKLSSFKISKNKASRLMRIGIPTATQETLSMLSFIVVESIINGLGVTAVAAAGVNDRIFNVAVIPASSFAAAIAAMVAQNSGAGEYERTRRCLGIGTAMSFAVGVLIFAVMWAFPQYIIGLFSNDQAVIQAGCQYMVFHKFEFLLCALSFCVNGYINGTGHTKYTMTVNLVSSFFVRMPLVIMFSRLANASLYHVGIALPSASLVQLGMGVVFLWFAKSEQRYRKNSISQ